MIVGTILLTGSFVEVGRSSPSEEDSGIVSVVRGDGRMCSGLDDTVWAAGRISRECMNKLICKLMSKQVNKEAC